MRSPSIDLAKNLARVNERIELAASRAGRHAEDITLIAVSKTHSARRIKELYEAGIRHFGENRVQERESKLAQVASLDAVWHMIGHVQKNKAARAAGLFDSVDSVDSIELAEKLDRARARVTSEKPLRVLIEVKLDPEPAKSGADEKELPRIVESILRTPHLELHGLMGVPPFFDNPEQTRAYFRRLRDLRDALRSTMGTESLPVLSMGMSDDFEVAIEEGATEVRVGTALFGQREQV